MNHIQKYLETISEGNVIHLPKRDRGDYHKEAKDATDEHDGNGPGHYEPHEGGERTKVHEHRMGDVHERLSDSGFKHKKVSGSHHIYTKGRTKVTITPHEKNPDYWHMHVKTEKE